MLWLLSHHISRTTGLPIFSIVVGDKQSTCFLLKFLLKQISCFSNRLSLHMWLGLCNGMLPIKHFSFKKSSLSSLEFHGDHMTVTKLRLIWPPTVLWVLPDLKLWCLSKKYLFLVIFSLKSSWPYNRDSLLMIDHWRLHLNC